MPILWGDFQPLWHRSGTGVMSIYAILVLLYNSFLHLTIMVALPLSMGGALLGLIAQNIGLYALIGIVLLLGIVTKTRSCWWTIH